jgi:hypothetical protein
MVRDDIDTDAAFAKRLRHDWYYLTPIMLLSVTGMFTSIYRAMRLDSVRRPNPQPHLSPAPPISCAMVELVSKSW